jgi:dnd system-associated protein 4
MANLDYSRSDRVYTDEATSEIYRNLKSGSDSGVEEAPFETFKDIFMWAACYGYQNGRRIRTNKVGNEIRISVFSEEDKAILKAIAIAATEDVGVLANFGEVMAIAEEYANGGIYSLKADLIDQRGRPLWNLVSISQQNRGGV